MGRRKPKRLKTGDKPDGEVVKVRVKVKVESDNDKEEESSDDDNDEEEEEKEEQVAQSALILLDATHAPHSFRTLTTNYQNFLTPNSST
jgi:hypothetical protein